MSQTLFTKVDFTLGALVDQIASGQLGLPDIQRPFVWRASKVRDLFDSMFRGYPVGYFLFWAVGVQPGTRQIGTHATQVAPSRLIVDGQQRLTSLFAVIRGVPVVRDDYTAARIEIAFNPLEDRFEVADAAIRRNPAFIADISDVWSPHTNLFQFAEAYLEKLRASRSLSKADTDRIQRALGRLHALTHYPFTALELAADVQAEHVSDVFVRINSQGKSLNQADFILTLMSVFWDEGRSALESFCRRARTPSDGTASPYNPLFQPAPSQLLRVAVAVGFRRARLSATYAVLRGRTDEGQSTTDAPEQHFAPLKSGQAAVLDLTNWHDFLGCIATAGYRSAESISSENALIFAYALYLIGRKDFAV